MSLERLSQRLVEDGVPPSLLVDLYDTAGMERALTAELAEVEADRTLQATSVPETAPDAKTA